MTTTSPLATLMIRLSRTGFTKPFVQSVMPEWWDKSLEGSQQSVLMLKMHLSKHLGLDLASLVDNRKKVQFLSSDTVHYRLTQGKGENDVSLATSMARSIARLVAAATPQPYIPISDDPSQVRGVIHRSEPWVSFQSLVEYAWKHGIPVIHLKKFPSGAKKFDGMVIDVDGRPVIVLSRQDKRPAWQLFILAHEIGHIGKGHVCRGAVFLDEKVSDDDSDDREEEATQYGMHLLTGSANTRIRSSHRLTGKELARIALNFGREHRVDPGHVALNYAHTMKCMGVAGAALKQLPGHYNAIEYVTEALYQNIDLEFLPEDSRSVLETVI